MDIQIALVALFVSLASFILSTYFAVQSMKSNKKSNELSESQKTMALISVIAPGCESPEQWKLFINYLSKNNRLPYFNDEDEEFLNSVLNRLAIKAKVVNGKISAEN